MTHDIYRTSFATITGTFHLPEAGWFIRLAGLYPVSVGMNEPPSAFCKGARVRLSVELANDTADTVEYDATIRRNQVVPSPRG